MRGVRPDFLTRSIDVLTTAARDIAREAVDADRLLLVQAAPHREGGVAVSYLAYDRDTAAALALHLADRGLVAGVSRDEEGAYTVVCRMRLADFAPYVVRD